MLFISSYNNAVSRWNQYSLLEFQDFQQLVVINGSTLALSPVQTPFGEYHPVRDSCQKVGDPSLEISNILYFQANLTNVTGPFDLQILSNSSSLDEITIDPFPLLVLGKKNILCEGNSESGFRSLLMDRNVCSHNCIKYGGVWDRNQTKCFVQTYVHKICLRVYFDQEMSSWSLYRISEDTSTNHTKDDSYGCDYQINDNFLNFVSTENWVPFYLRHETPCFHSVRGSLLPISFL